MHILFTGFIVLAYIVSINDFLFLWSFKKKLTLVLGLVALIFLCDYVGDLLSRKSPEQQHLEAQILADVIAETNTQFANE